MFREQTRYSRLADITKIINTKLDLRELLEQVTIAVSEEIVQCNSVGIYLPQDDGSFRGYVGDEGMVLLFPSGDKGTLCPNDADYDHNLLSSRLTVSISNSL